MERKKNDSLKENKENKYIGSIATLILSIAFAFVILVSIQAIMGDKTVTLSDNKAEQYYYDGKFDESINEYKLMQSKDEWPIWTVKEAEVYSVKGDITKSDNLLREAIVKRDKLMAENGDKYIEQDKELINQVIFTFYINNELEQAESFGKYYLDLYNTYKPLLKTMFAVYLGNDDKKLAEEVVNSYPVDTKSAYDLAILAKMQIMLGNYDDGLDNLKKSYELDKNEIKSFDVIMETCEFDKNNLLKKVKKLLEENPQEEVYKIWLNEINSLDESNMNLINILNDEVNSTIEVDKLDEKSYVYNYVKALELYNNGEYDKALEYCNNAIIDNPLYSNVYGILIPEILIAKGSLDKLEGYFRTALYNEPFNYNLITSIGKIYENDLKNYEKAKESFNFALSLNKNEDAIYYDLAFVNLAMRDNDEAVVNLKKAISINEDNYKYYRSLGTVYFNNKDYEKAIENIRKAYSLNEKDALILNNAACYYVMVDKDIWRGYSNIESAYNDMQDDLDQESKELITSNYEAIKKVYDKYVNDENTIINLENLKLSY